MRVLPLPIVAVSLSAASLIGCGQEATCPPAPSPELFVEITEEAGLGSLVSEALTDGTYDVPEIMGGGIALFDYDSDGDLDLLRICSLPADHARGPASNRLFQQQPDRGFAEVTRAAGFDHPGYGQGAAIGDVDNDGDPDLYVTNIGPDSFYLNNGDGTFTDVTARAGFAGGEWSASATFVDYDGDGDLDLFVVHYLEYALGTICTDVSGSPEYCGPQHFSGTLDRLYRNEGDGTFSDVSAPAGINSPGKGLGIVAADLTDDGRIDLYVTNDADVNHLWVNNGDGAFTDEAVARGVGVNAYGRTEASMGITIGDANHDGILDLFMTHLIDETNTFFLSLNESMYVDASSASGFGTTDFSYTGFGCGFFDFDHDSDLDLLIVNGRIMRGPPHPGAPASPFWEKYAEPNFLFENDGAGRFGNCSERAGLLASRVDVSRGVAFGDLDDDGDLDLAVAHLLSGLRLFHNQAPPAGSHWLRVRAVTGKRDALGACVTVRAAGKALIRIVQANYSYLSASDPRVHFGLGAVEKVEAIEVRWSDGTRERFGAAGVDRDVVVRKGSGDTL